MASFLIHPTRRGAKQFRRLHTAVRKSRVRASFTDANRGNVGDRVPGEALIGTLFANRYEVEALLGEGGMGVVYRARHVRIGRLFALKVLHRRLARSKVIQRFEREAELAGKLSHANVVPVVDLSTTDGGDLYLVMDFVEGPSLADLLVEAPMPAERVIHLARQLCDGLGHAHAMGLVHRDFKPENVIVSRDSRGFELPRIVDFGVAILRDDMREATERGDRLTTDGMVVGTPHYMSPEQIRGESIDARSDLFALGIIMFELLTGRLPFDGDGADVARANLMAHTPRMKARLPTAEVDPLLEAVVARLLEKDPAMRPQTAAEVRALLDLVEGDRPAAMHALGLVVPEPVAPVRETTVRPDPPPADAVSVEPRVSSEPRRDLRTGSRRALRAGSSSHERIIIIAGFALLAVALIIALMRRDRAPAAAVAPPPPTREARVVTVPVPMPVDRPAPVDPPTPVPVPRPAPVPVRPAPVALTTPAPKPAETRGPTSAAELAALYRSVGQTLERLDRDHADGLWQRYRWIRLADYLTTAEKRAEAARMLDAIALDARRK
jgi:serine/threonine-protein kinase